MNDRVFAVDLQSGYNDLLHVGLSQYDVGVVLEFDVFDGGAAAVFPSGTTAKIQGVRPSGVGFDISCTLTGNVVTVSTVTDMTGEAGIFPVEIRFYNSGVNVGTCNFIFGIEKAAHPDGTIDADITRQETFIERLEKLETDTATDPTLSISGRPADAKATGDQISELKNDLSVVEEGNVVLNLIADKYVRNDNGALGSYVGWSATDFIPCAGYRALYVKGTVQTRYNAFYSDADANTFIRSFTTENGFTNVAVPENAKYFRLSNTTSAMQATEVFDLWHTKLTDSVQTLKDISGSANYIDGIGWTDGYSISESGAISAASGFRYSDLIPISDGYYYLSYIPNGQNRNTRIHGYDSNGTWVKQIGVTANYTGTSQIIFDFWCDGVTSIRISTGTTQYTYITGLYKGANMTRLDNNMVWEEIPMSSGEITTNNNTQYIPNYSIYINTSNPRARCAVIDCDGGDYFTINAYGAGGPRAYAFVDSTNKILAMAKGHEEVHGIFQAPSGSKKLVINDYRGFTSFKGVEPVSGFEKLSDVQTVNPAQLGSKNWVARLGWEAESVGTGGPPRQSIVSYRMAYNHDCRIMLADLQVTADNVLVCLHDASLDTYVRHPDGSVLSTEEKAQLVKNMTLAELNAYDWGIFYGAIYAGTKVLTVDEFLRFCSYTGCIAVIETKITLTTANIEALKDLAVKHCMVDRIVLFDDISRYAANRTAWETNFPKNDVVFNNVTTDNVYNAAKTLTASRTSSGLNTSISTSFGYITDAKIAEYNALGGTFYYTEVTEESDLDTLMEDGHLDCLRYIASSYININKWLKEQYSF